MKIGVRLLNGKKQEQSKHELRTSEIEEMQLPIERLGTSGVLGSAMNVKGKESCAFCEYLMHYLQKAITSPASEVNFLQLKVITITAIVLQLGSYFFFLGRIEATFGWSLQKIAKICRVNLRGVCQPMGRCRCRYFGTRI